MSTRSLVRKAFEVLPEPYGAVAVDHVRGRLVPEHRSLRRDRRRVYASYGAPEEILAGPFRGMRFAYPPVGTNPNPKFLGVYEKELHGVVERLVGLSPDVIVNVGSADGYYGVGLARRLPGARVVAYDPLRFAHYQLRKVARLNGVSDRIEQRGMGSPESVAEDLRGSSRPAIVIDCEGCEDAILDPARTPGVERSIMLVEVHESFAPGVTQHLLDRFGGTHEIERIEMAERGREDLPAGVSVAEGALEHAIREVRTIEIHWFVMWPRGGG